MQVTSFAVGVSGLSAGTVSTESARISVLCATLAVVCKA